MNTQDVKFDGWPHVIKAQQFSREWLEEIFFPLSDIMETAEKCIIRNMLPGREMISLFVAESSRTRASFEIAMRRLGGQVIFGSEAAGKFSSMAKGESIEDTITVFNEYGADVIVLRLAEEGGAEKAAFVSEIPIINAGDGSGQHPTQALLDLRTIKKHLQRIDKSEYALMGDIEGSRTIHSLAYLLSRYSDITIHFVAPPHLKIKSGIKDHLLEHGVKISEVKDVREIAGRVDVFYQTRTQTNLGTVAWDRKDCANGLTIINKEVLEMAKPGAIILHPLPCNDEIVRAEVDSDPRAVYIKTKEGRMSQVKCGLFIREALLLTVISPETCPGILSY